MKKWKQSWLAGAIASAFLSASLAHAETPRDAAAKDLLGLVLKEQRLVVCGEDAKCWRRKVLSLDEGLEGALQHIDFLEFRIQLLLNENGHLKTIRFEQTETINAIKPVLLDQSKPPSVAQSPVLWFGVGAVAMGIICISIFAVAKRIDVSMQNR